MKINVVFEVSGYKCWQLTFLQTTDTSKVAFVDSGAVIIRQTADHSSSHTTGYLFKVIWEYFKTFLWWQICFLKGILHKFQIVVVATELASSREVRPSLWQPKQVFSAKPQCFVDLNHVFFMAKPNHRTGTGLWQEPAETFSCKLSLVLQEHTLTFILAVGLFPSSPTLAEMLSSSQTNVSRVQLSLRASYQGRLLHRDQ